MSNGSDPVNWLFLVELAVVVIVCSAFLFYWNRILGGAIAFVLRLAWWRAFNAYVVIGSFQISPLAGRISFRDVEYHSSNISFRALHGNITFRYWLFRTRQEGDTDSPNRKRSRLPCRITVKVEGVETFCFNRTPAYDAILERMKKHEAQAAAASGKDLYTSESAGSEAQRPKRGIRLRKFGRQSSQDRDGSETGSSKPPSTPNEDIPPLRSHVVESTVESTGVSWLHELLPIEIHVETGNIVLGSDATPMVLIVDFKSATGTVEVADSRSPCDHYKLNANFSLAGVNVLMRTNVDYTGPLLAHGKKVYDELAKSCPDIYSEAPSKITSRSGFHVLAKRFLKLLDPKFALPSIHPPTDKVWKGLARFRLTEEKDGGTVHREDRQYAKVTTLLSTRTLDVNYYADSAGPVPDRANVNHLDPNDKIGNIDFPPEYGVDITIHGGVVNYGPWADRQRDALQKAFAPSIFFDSEPRAHLKRGDSRVASHMVVNVLISEQTTLRIPTREPSKDWNFEGKKANLPRPYAWLDVEVGANSSVTYTQTQIATEHGYDSMLVLHLDSLRMASSVNTETFVSAKACKLSMTMPVPLVWNAQRNWGIDLALDTPQLELLREHITLISDLAKDWSSASAGDFHHFVPMHYNFRVLLSNYDVRLGINDFNIIDLPRSRVDNAFVDIRGPALTAFAAVSSTRYRPEFSVVPFTVEASNAQVDVSLPNWDTQHSFGTDGADGELEVGKIGNIKVSGSYRYYSTPSPTHLEMLNLNLDAERVAFKALGWVVRRLFCVKDNYFGGFTQFSTTTEFLERFDHSPDSVGDPVVQKYRPGRSDPFAVHLTVDVRDSLVLLSDEIYSSSNGAVLPVPQLQLDLKTNEYQMDMSLDLAPTYIVACDDLKEHYQDFKAPLAPSQDAIFVSGLAITANRLFGPQPKATTYVCIWDISVERISAFVSPEFKATLLAVVSALDYTFDDVDNAPSKVYAAPSLPDATFVKVSIQHISALVSSGNSGIAVELPLGVFVDTSSMASQLCKSVIGIGVPSVTAHIVKKQSNKKGWIPVGSLSTGLAFDMYKMPRDWQQLATAQHLFLREQDEPTKRIPFLYGAPDDPAPGRHFYGVYTPRPRQVPKREDDNGSFSESTEEMPWDPFEHSTSSPGSSGESELSLMRSKLQARGPQPAHSVSLSHHGSHDVGIESDSTSTGTSSVSSISTAPTIDTDDIAAMLEERLLSIQLIHIRARKLFNSGPVESEGDTTPTLGTLTGSLKIEDGSVGRVNLDRVVVELNPDSVHAAADLAGALGAVSVRPEMMLDQLLTDQVSTALRDTSKDGSTMFDITAPSVNVKIVLGNFAQPDTLVKVDIKGSHYRLVKAAGAYASDDSTLDTEIGIRSVELVTCDRTAPLNAISLIDVPELDFQPIGKLLPFNRVLILGLEGTLHSQPRAESIVAKVKEFTFQGVTPGIPIVSNILAQWLPVLKKLPTHKPNLTYAELIYSILSRAIRNGDTTQLPPFDSAGSYALHVSDQRNIRRDQGWYTLARLRYWLRLGDGDVVLNNPPIPSAEMAKFVTVELAHLDELMGVTENMVVNQPFMRKAFGSDVEGLRCTLETEVDSSARAHIRLELVALKEYDRMLETNVIIPAVIILRNASIAGDQNTHWDNGIPTKTITPMIELGELAIDIRSSFVSAYQALLTQIDTYDEDINHIPVVESINYASHIVADVRLDHVSAGITAGGLRVDLIISGCQSTMTVDRSRLSTGAVIQEINSDQGLLSCRSVQVILREGSDLPNPTEASPERALILTGAKEISCTAASTMSNLDPRSGLLRLLFGVKEFEFESRPQLKAFYDFGRDWRKNHYELYHPALEQTKAVLAHHRERQVLKKAAGSGPPIVVVQEQPRFDRAAMSKVVDIYVGSARLQARAAKDLWLGLDAGNMYVQGKDKAGHLGFGLRFEPQVIGAYTTAKRIKSKDSSVIRLPSIEATGTYIGGSNRQNQVHASVALGMFTGVIKPIALDRLLSLHARLGNDVVEVIREYRGQKTETQEFPNADSRSAAEHSSKPLLFDIGASVAGVRVGLRADDVPSTLVFEALSLEASATNIHSSTLQWLARANHVGLSLGRFAESLLRQTNEPVKGSKSMFMSLDISADERPSVGFAPATLTVGLSRVHAVMHVAALSEVSDLVKSWSNDISLLNDVRGAEVAEVKEQTTRVLKTLEANSGRDSRDPAITHSAGVSTSGMSLSDTSTIETWFSSRVLKVEVRGIGVAIPLDEGSGIDIHRRGPGPALLLSVRLMSLKTSRSETAHFIEQQTFLKFVDKFDPTVPDHFSGEYHSSGNCMTLPNIDSRAQLTTTSDMWNVTAHCSAVDFKLSLTPEIADGVAQLVILYDQGKAHLSQMERDYRAEWARTERDDSVAVKYEEQLQASSAARSSRQVVVRTSFRFDSGLVELCVPKSQQDRNRPERIRPDRPRPDRNRPEFHHPHRHGRATHEDTFTLPTVSVWIDYSGPSEADNDRMGMVLFNMAVHESHNILRPTILPFFVELVRRGELRSKERQLVMEQRRLATESEGAKGNSSSAGSPSARSLTLLASPSSRPVALPGSPSSRASLAPPSPSRRISLLPELSPPITIAAERAMDAIAVSPTGKLRLRITLRIDRSELRLSCAPDSNAYLDLKWESGGFVASTLLGGKDTTTFGGTVSGVTAYLSHEFAEQGRGCVTAGAKDLAFSLALCSGSGEPRGLSAIVDTQVSIQFRLEAYSAWLIFMAVWVDNAPKFSRVEPASQPVLPNTSGPVVAPGPLIGGDKLGLAVLVRLRSIDFDANVSVTQAKLQIVPIVVRTVSNGEQTELDVNIGVTRVTAKGDISGDVKSESLKFHTLRRSSRSTISDDPNVLRMAIEGGDLSGNLFIGDMNIVRFQLQPSKVTLADDWSAYAVDPIDGQVRLDFIVKCEKFFGVLRLPAIPRLLGHFYTIFDLAESQKNIAKQRSETFKQRQTATSTTPLSVAFSKSPATKAPPVNALTAAATDVTATAQAAASQVKTAQTMRFELSGLDIGIFSDDYDDGSIAEFFRFYLGKITADLKRHVSSSGQPLRELLLSVLFAEWQTSDGAKATKAENEEHDLSAKDLIEAAVKPGHRDVVVLPRLTLNMNSTELRGPPTVLDYDFDVVWGETDGDIKILPQFFQAAFKSFKKLIQGIDDQNLARDRRRGRSQTSRKSRAGPAKAQAAASDTKLQFHRRGTGPFNNPVPKLRALGETTGDAAMMIPRIKEGVGELPAYSHRFVTLPLEEGMDILLKLYERQLPDIQ